MVKNPIISDIRKRFLKTTDLKAFRGFTLAEVLITLVIIGVIASMTIPTLMNNTQKQEFVSQLTKTYSTLSQGLNQIWNNNDTAPGDYEFFNDHNFLDEFAKVSNIEKKCDTIVACIGENIYDRHRYLNGNNLNSTAFGDGKTVITADGQMISFVKTVISASGLSAEDTANLLGRIIVDVNGNKGPNKIGVDTFLFYLVKGKGILPAGLENSSTCIKSAGGQGCTAKVLKEKAINYI